MAIAVAILGHPSVKMIAGITSPSFSTPPELPLKASINFVMIQLKEGCDTGKHSSYCESAGDKGTEIEMQTMGTEWGQDEQRISHQEGAKKYTKERVRAELTC